MKLDDTSGEPTGAIGSVELEHSMRPVILTDRILHSGVFLHRRLGKLLPQGQHLPQKFRCGFQKFRHRFFIKGIRLHSVLRKPLLHLLYRIRIFQIGQLLHCIGQLFTGFVIHCNRLPHQLHIHADAPVIDLLILPVFLPHEIRHREFGEPLLNLHLRLHIPKVIRLEPFPFLCVMLRQVSRPAAVYFRGLTGNAEIPDQVFALGQLLLFQSKRRTHALQ